MSTHHFSSVLAVFLVVTLLVPASLFVAPQRAHAVWGVGDVVSVSGDWSTPALTTAAKTTFSAIKESLIEVHTYTSAVAEYAQYINTYVLQPMAFVLSGNLMKALTSSAIQFVIGKSNGTGSPQFATNLMRSLQTVSDGAALAFLRQAQSQPNQPFASSIAQALGANYDYKSSLAGFWKQNMCTLNKSSSNMNGFLAGNWSGGGGIAAWFALTTQPQNNPYTLYRSQKEQLASVVGGVTTARTTQLNWGQGMLSWCGSVDANNVNTSPISTVSASGNTTSLSSSATALPTGDMSGAFGTTANFNATDAALPSGNSITPSSVTANALMAEGKASLPTKIGVSPGDPCQQADGTLGTIRTPGSVIQATLNKTLGGQQDKLANMGSLASEITGILGNIAKVWQTVSLATAILGGNGSGGLLGAGTASSGGTSLLDQLGTNSPTGTDYLGTSISQIQNNATASDVTSAMSNGVVSNTETLVTEYQKAWDSISAAATTASSSVLSLKSFCTANANAAGSQTFRDAALAQATAAQTALTTEIAPVSAQATAAYAQIRTTRAMAQKVGNEYISGSSSAGADAQILQGMPPTSSDIAKAQNDASSPIASLNASASQVASLATPAGSLTVATSSTVSLADQMYIIGVIAQSLKTSGCTYYEPIVSN